MADYSRFLFDAINGVGDPIVAARTQAAQQAVTDRNYARQLGLDTQSQSNADRTFSAGRSDAAAEQAYRNRSLGLQEKQIDLTAGVPAGYMRDAANPSALAFRPGGPADPEVLKRDASARKLLDTRPLPTSAVTDLGKKGESVVNQTRFGDTFKDEYAGKMAGPVGTAQNLIGRNIGGGYEDQANWWQDYQAHKNAVRNQLFGSALTAQEKSEWDKADINPGMKPDVIRKNLDRQKAAATRAAQKVANAYTKMGFAPDVIEGALGVPLGDLGVTPPAAKGGAGGAAGDPLAGARAAIAKGADPAAVAKRLRENGIDPGGL